MSSYATAEAWVESDGPYVDLKVRIVQASGTITEYSIRNIPRFEWDSPACQTYANWVWHKLVLFVERTSR